MDQLDGDEVDGDEAGVKPDQPGGWSGFLMHRTLVRGYDLSMIYLLCTVYVHMIFDAIKCNIITIYTIVGYLF